MQELERIRELVHEIAGVPGEQVTPESTVDESSIHSVGDLLSMLQKTA